MRATLAPFLTSLRLTSHRADARPFVRLPHGEVELVVRSGSHGVDVHALGPRSKALRKDLAGLETITARFAVARASRFLGAPIVALNERIVPIETLWGEQGRRLVDALSAARGAAERIATLEDALASRLGDDDADTTATFVARRAIALLHGSTDLPRVSAIADAIGVSERQLRRAFEKTTGLGPKEFVRLVRFERAVRAASGSSPPDWGAIARSHGFYDQAHLIAESHAIAGTTPTTLMRELAARYSPADSIP